MTRAAFGRNMWADKAILRGTAPLTSICVVSRKQFMLKSTTGPLANLTASVSLPPPDGSGLQRVYDAETVYLRAMRDERAPAQWYSWIPHLSLSVSRREAQMLGDFSHFKDEPVAVRQTGGTAVPQGPGTLNVSVFLRRPGPPQIRETYLALVEALKEGFAGIGLETTHGAREGSFCDGEFNLLHEGRKLVGTAQRWASDGSGGSLCLMHCAILSGGDPKWLCARTEALYAACGIDRRYDPDAHSGLVINRAELDAALAGPLHRLIQSPE